jgi:hypothetical protein
MTPTARSEAAMRSAISAFLLALVTFASCGGPAAAQSLPAAVEDVPGSDVIAVKSCRLRPSPTLASRPGTRLPSGTAAVLRDSTERFLLVEEADGTSGWVERSAAALFPPGEDGTRDLARFGKSLAGTSLVPIAAGALSRALERQKCDGRFDPETAVFLGESGEALAASGGPYPAGFPVIHGADPATGKSRDVYSGMSFDEAAARLSSAGDDRRALSERAAAGAVRRRFPSPGSTLLALWTEVGDWLELLESAQSPRVRRDAARRLGDAALPLGRYLLAVGRIDDLARLQKRIEDAAPLLVEGLPSDEAGRLASRAFVLAAMRGDGSRSFPQEAAVRIPEGERRARISGDIGSLVLDAGDGRSPGGVHPVLPVPGSLRISPDGRFAAWLEVARPGLVTPAIVRLSGGAKTEEPAFLSGGRPLRDRLRRNVVTTIEGFSKDGARVALATRAWDETAPRIPHLAVLSTSTGARVFEGTGSSRNRRLVRRLLEKSQRPSGSGQ